MNVRALLGSTAVLAATFLVPEIASAREVCGAPSGLNVRSGPSLHARVRTIAENGDDFAKVYDRSNNGKWLKVRVDGTTGWVYRGYTCGESRSRTRGNAGGTGSGQIARYRNPVMGACVTSDFGPRRRPRPGASSFHQGCDLGAGCGTPVRSTAPGRVVFAGWNGGYGNTVIVQHPNGTRSLYAHLSRINVRPGTRPTSNMTLGRVGTTGVSTGCHLHFSIYRSGRLVDPQNYIGQRGCPSYGISSGARWIRP